MSTVFVVGRVISPLPDDAFFGFEWVRQQVSPSKEPIEGLPTAALAALQTLRV
jgi:hypothetical protein